jgi:hypothetical protein
MAMLMSIDRARDRPTADIRESGRTIQEEMTSGGGDTLDVSSAPRARFNVKYARRF